MKSFEKDELKVAFVLFFVIVFFSQNLIINIFCFIITIIVTFGMWFFRNKHFPSSNSNPIEFSHKIFAILCCAVLFFVTIARILNNQLNSPLEIYWILFLSWNAIIWGIVAIYLSIHKKNISFLEGLRNSLFFFYGLSVKKKGIAFIGSLILGGIPTYYVTKLSQEKIILVPIFFIGVITLTIFSSFIAIPKKISYEEKETFHSS